MAALELVRPLRDRDFRLLWIGQATSLVGDGVFTVALAWQVYDLSPGPTALSVVLAARSIPMILLLLVGGAVTDRIPRRLVMLASDLVRGLAVGLLGILTAASLVHLWHVVALAAIFGAADAFFYPAYTSIVPELLPAALLLPANALESTVRPLALSLAGPALGGLLVGRIGTVPAFAFDAATFGVSALTLSAMRTRTGPTASGRSMLRDIADGYRYARSEAWIWVTLVVAACAVLLAVGPFDVLMPLIVRERLHAGAEGYGAILAASGAGGIVAALLAAQRGNPRRRITAMFFMWGGGTLAFALTALPRHIALTIALAVIMGFAFESGSIFWATMLQEWVPNRLLGRVRSLDFLVSFALMPVSYALVGPVAAVAGTVPTIAVGGTLASLFWFVGLFWPRVRDRESRPTTPHMD